MGPTGAGKSQFIESALQDPALKIAKESLQSQTQAIVPYRLSQRPGKHNHDDSVVLVDTPGFDDTYRDDQKTLALIGKWLKQQHQSNLLLAGVLWFHRINDSRMNKTAIDNFNMFVELCGTEAASSVVFVTTMWDLPTQGQSAEANLRQLQGEYWKVRITQLMP
ncbi:hypothetical protein BJ165DRAFT_1478870 [Panaeolus papilionaceus]|nr:hypothetical protein BJ165DRAFT_1478870 [Panaeolus papilionaceus]